MAENDNKRERNIVFYTAYINYLRSLGDQATHLSKRYIVSQIVDEFFISVDRGLRIVNEMVKEDLNIDTLNKTGAKLNIIKEILNKHFE